MFAAANRNDAEATLSRARLLLDASAGQGELAQAYEAGAVALRLADDLSVSWALGREGLARLGFRLPPTASKSALALAAIRWRLGRLCAPRAAIAVAEGMSRDDYTRVAHVAATAVYERDPDMAALVALRGLALEPRSGSRSAYWLAVETFVCASLGEFERAAELGELVVSSPIRTGFGDAATLYRALYWGLIWRRPQAELRPRCDEVRDLAIAEGDLVHAAIAIRNRLLLGWRTCASLEALRGEIEEARRDVAMIGEPAAQLLLDELDGVVSRLQQRNGPPILDLAEQIANYDSPDMRPRAVLAMEVASLSRDWSGAAALARRLRSAKHTFDSHPGGAVWRFHEAIWLLKTGKAVPRSDRRYLRRAAQLNPLDHRHKFLVVEAETLRARGDPACLTAFGVAVEAALASSSRLEAGVAAELACEAAREFGQAELAERHAARAQEIWSGWGALAKLALRAAGARPHELATPLVEAQAEVEAARLQDRAKSRLLAEVAHELRTPLQGMQGLLDLAADDQALLDVGAFREVFASLRAVIDDLTDYGAVTSGEAPLASFKVDLAALIRSEVAVASSLEALRHARIEVELAGEAPAWIRTDAPRVRQVLRNLLSNAAKYGGGEFVLVRLEVLGKAESGLVDLAISVEDSGPGLGAGDSLLLFEPFERGSRQGDGAGLGLGLALSRKIARRLGGDLTGENRSEGGARFVFSFQAPEAKDDSTRDPARPARELRIVVADDIELSRRVVSAILRRRGHGVVEARDGIEALNAIADGPCDLAILDMAMPGASGVEVLRRLGAGAGGGRPASILLTASSLQEVGEDAKAAGVDLVLRKPVSADDLDRALASLFQDQRREDADLGAGLAAELARLAGLARMELRERIGDLLVHLGQGDFPDSAADAHRIAGLAAQFGWSQIAEAADALELALKCGSGEAKSKAARLQAAAQALEDGRSAA